MQRTPFRTLLTFVALTVAACGPSDIDKKSPPPVVIDETDDPSQSNENDQSDGKDDSATNNGSDDSSGTNDDTTSPIVDSCGDGVVDADEACDGSTVVTCEEMGFDGGSTSCSADCLIDLSQCTRVSCGDGILDEREACDDGELNGAYGYCNTNCSGPAAHCGDGIANGPEECDGGDLREQTCADVGFDRGELRCSASCELRTDACVLAYCGDGIIDAGEACDDGDDNGTYGACNGTCTGPGAACGDGIINGGEQCDGNAVSQTCESLGLGRGEITCSPSCRNETDACSMAPRAGEVFVSEIMPNPAALLDNDGEWFEVHNLHYASVSLDGCTIESGTANGPESFDVEAATIGAGQYYTFARGNDPGFAPDYEYGAAINLNNSVDYIRILCPDPYTGQVALVDEVHYDDGATFPDPDGATMSFHRFTTSTQFQQSASYNDDGAYWCTPLTTFGYGDLGTPGTANPTCF